MLNDLYFITGGIIAPRYTYEEYIAVTKIQKMCFRYFLWDQYTVLKCGWVQRVNERKLYYENIDMGISVWEKPLDIRILPCESTAPKIELDLYHNLLWTVIYHKFVTKTLCIYNLQILLDIITYQVIHTL